MDTRGGWAQVFGCDSPEVLLTATTADA